MKKILLLILLMVMILSVNGYATYYGEFRDSTGTARDSIPMVVTTFDSVGNKTNADSVICRRYYRGSLLIDSTKLNGNGNLATAFYMVKKQAVSGSRYGGYTVLWDWWKGTYPGSNTSAYTVFSDSVTAVGRVATLTTAAPLLANDSTRFRTWSVGNLLTAAPILANDSTRFLNWTIKNVTDVNAQLVTAQADLDNPSQYKATGFATSTQGDSITNAIADVNKGNFKANVTNLDVAVSTRTPWSCAESLLTTIGYDADSSLSAFIRYLYTSLGYDADSSVHTFLRYLFTATGYDADSSLSAFVRYIHNKTTNLPPTPASGIGVDSIRTTLGYDADSSVSIIIRYLLVATGYDADSSLSSFVRWIHNKTTNLPDDPADQSLIMAEVENLDGWNPITDNESLIVDQSTVLANAEVLNIDGWNPITDNESLIVDQSTMVGGGGGSVPESLLAQVSSINTFVHDSTFNASTDTLKFVRQTIRTDSTFALDWRGVNNDTATNNLSNTRILRLNELDEDNTTIDLNSTSLGSVTGSVVLSATDKSVLADTIDNHAMTITPADKSIIADTVDNHPMILTAADKSVIADTVDNHPVIVGSASTNAFEEGDFTAGYHHKIALDSDSGNVSGAVTDWNALERSQIRLSLGMTGDTSSLEDYGYVPSIKLKTDKIRFYASGDTAIISYGINASGTAPTAYENARANWRYPLDSTFASTLAGWYLHKTWDRIDTNFNATISSRGTSTFNPATESVQVNGGVVDTARNAGTTGDSMYLFQSEKELLANIVQESIRQESLIYQGAASGLTGSAVAVIVLDTLKKFYGYVTPNCSLLVLDDDGDPVIGAMVDIKSSDGTMLLRRITTNNLGKIKPQLDTLTSYRIYVTLTGYNQDNTWDTFTVTSPGDYDTVLTTAFDPGTPIDPLKCRLYQCAIKDFMGNILVNVKVTVILNSTEDKLYDSTGVLIVSKSSKKNVTYTDATGFWHADVYMNDKLYKKSDATFIDAGTTYTVEIEMPEETVKYKNLDTESKIQFRVGSD